MSDTKQQGTGVGLRNTQERLHNIYGDSFELSVTEAEPCGARVMIRIPSGDLVSFSRLDKAYA
jgi:LytS/YehU family sensor histidine kinase